MRARFGVVVSLWCSGCRFDLPQVIDAPAAPEPRDADIDAPSCPAEYMSLPNDAANPHRYRRAPQSLNWDAQRAFCAQTSSKAYLAVPDSPAELADLYMLAGNATFWVGIDDRVTEGTYVQAMAGPATFLTWANGQPDNLGGGGGQDCVAGTATTISDEACAGGGGANRPAACECVP